MQALSAQWFDGRQARSQLVSLHWAAGAAPDAGELVLTLADGRSQRIPAQHIVWPERTRHGQRQVMLPDGGVLTVADAQAWDSWFATTGLPQPLAVRWASSWRASILALVLLAVLMLVSWRWGIPWAARQLTPWVPDRVVVSISQAALADMSERGLLKPSTLSKPQQARIQQAVADMVVRGFPAGNAPRYTLHFHRAADWLGPNAFALPNGDIVLTDALVTLLQDAKQEAVDHSILGVVAHELGHVQHQHGLRLVFEAGALSVLTGWWLGDYSLLMQAAPTLLMQAGYSRGHEREADEVALRTMRAAGVDPRAMARFFQAIAKARPQRDPDSEHFGLSSHPADSERIRFFESADPAPVSSVQ